MEINVLSFGKLAQITGNQFIIKDQVPDTDSLQQWLHRQYPDLSALKYRLAVNKEIIQGNQPISSPATVALLPPFSGG